LILYLDRIRDNIREMIRIAGGTQRLRPHIKTHKISELISMQLEEGITKFKCATIAEAEMAARAGAAEVLIAYQPTGPNAGRICDLQEKFHATRFSTVVDNMDTAEKLASAFKFCHRPLPIFLDLDCGMHRTGIAPGEEALRIYEFISNSPRLEAGGLHAYDGHIHDADLRERERKCEESFQAVANFTRQLEQKGMKVPTVIAGGTPTFPIHAKNHPAYECSPGTPLLWDFGYGQKFGDMEFKVAAVLMTRVVSKPMPDRLCLDLGYKAVASENPHPRAQFLDIPEPKPLMHSEEHMVIETPLAASLNVGDVLYATPRHICPTVALFDEVIIAGEGAAYGTWSVAARTRKISV
ncbi:MAG: D-TA family PLP-dependent enzyme, partial [Verrucomicrobiales bacterium]